MNIHLYNAVEKVAKEYGIECISGNPFPVPCFENSVFFLYGEKWSDPAPFSMITESTIEHSVKQLFNLAFDQEQKPSKVSVY